MVFARDFISWRRQRNDEQIKLIECPRDACRVTGSDPTDYKAAYLKELVVAGFKHIDAVSFVSPKHVKQMRQRKSDAKFHASLLAGVEPPEIIGIVVNQKGLNARWPLQV